MISLFHRASSELEKGIRLSRCRKCGCMRGTLENLKASLPSLEDKVSADRYQEAKDLLKQVHEHVNKLEPLEYPCLGCKYCIPAEAMTKLTSGFPSLASTTLSSCEFEVSKNSWPPVSGEYTVLDKAGPVAVSVLASTKLEEKLAQSRPNGLCIIGKTETENIGIDKIVKNIITNPAIRVLIVAGRDPEGHKSGKTLTALWQNGVDKNMRVIGSTGRRPILKNITLSDINKFRKQIQIDDQIGCENTGILVRRIKEFSGGAVQAKRGATRNTATILQKLTVSNLQNPSPGCGCHGCCDDAVEEAETGATAPKITAQKPKSVKLDKAGYFVIIPSKKKKIITVEHYSYDNKLLRIIEGKNSRDIYSTITSNRWVTDLSHAAYIGKELAKAELSIAKGFKFVQDGA